MRSYATALAAGPALLVRGSSRRITTMMARREARSTNIRLINRRRSCFDRCLVCFTRNKSRPLTKDLVLDRSFHIRSPSEN